VQQTGMRPNAVVLVYCIQFIEPHDPDRATNPRLGLARDLFDAVGGVELEASGQYFFAIATAPSTEFKNTRSWRQKLKEGVQMSAYAAGSAGHIDGRLIGIEAKRRLIACDMFGC
jgi:hypothetical protein